ncbi:MAG: response regulator [Cyanobacteria bacterium J06632_22]
MTMDPEIRDQAYQFFIEEAPELLEVIEAGLLNLRQDSSTAQLHEIMRAAHSIKGGAASVDLHSLKTLAHRLETIFKALYGDQVTITPELERQLLLAYDCLREPLVAQMETGHHDEDGAIATAEPILTALEAQLGSALDNVDSFIPSAADLGIDMVASMFEIDVQQGIDRLTTALSQASAAEQRGELLAQTEVFSGFAELFSLPGFGAICEAAEQAVKAQPDQVSDILQHTIQDLTAARSAVLAGDREQGGKPSEALLATATANSSSLGTDVTQDIDLAQDMDLARDMGLAQDMDLAQDIDLIQDLSTGLGQDLDPDLDSGLLEDVFDIAAASNPDDLSLLETDLTQDIAQGLEQDMDPDLDPDLLDDVFGAADPTSTASPLDALSSDGDLLDDLDGMLGGPDGILSDTDLATDQAASDDLFLNASSSPATPDWTLNGLDNALSEPTARAENDNNVFDLDLDEDLMGTALETTDDPVLDSTELLADPDLPPVPDNVSAAIETITEHFDALPVANILPAPTAALPAKASPAKASPAKTPSLQAPVPQQPTPGPALTPPKASPSGAPTKTLTARIALERLERMDNLVGELAINRNSLSLQNEQFQRTVRSLKQRFGQFRGLARQLQTLSDKLLVSPESVSAASPLATTAAQVDTTQFDTLQMDSYSAVNVMLEALLEEVLQVEEAIEDVQLFAGQSNRKLDQQRQFLTQLRDELMWSRMVPLSGVLNRFPRMLRELSTDQNKPAELKLVGTQVLVDRVVLEKLYDPLLHLLRNAFDHGLEPPTRRVQQGKPETGTIEIRAYRRGNSIFVSIQDDGQGLSVEKIGQRAVAAGLITAEGMAAARSQQVYDLIFEPGFSTADQVSEVSGRGMGMDIVRSRLQSLNGKVTLTTEPGKGTTFTLRIPLTLTLSKLVVTEAGDSIVALAADSIEEILIPTDSQLKTTAGQRFLIWRDQVVPIHTLAEWLPYACPVAQRKNPMAATMAGRYQTKKPLLILQQGQSSMALEIDQVLTEQELVIKPFGGAIAPPSYINGCTVLGDGQLVPVIDGTSVIGYSASSSRPAVPAASAPSPISQAPTVLIIDDSSAMRRTLALTLQKAGYQVDQARDGREALERLQQGQLPQLMVCDVEMPRMNGFEFLSQRRLQTHLAAIPTLMLTSRSSPKHRLLAKQLGATAYFTKPYIEAEFLQTLRNYLTAVPAAPR